MKMTFEKIEKEVERFGKEFDEVMSNLPDNLMPQDITNLRVGVSAIYSAYCHKKMEMAHMGYTGWKDNIADELMSAKEKYEAYLKSNDSTMLEMARQELQHALYYLNQAKMSPDMELRKKVPGYQKEYDEFALKLNAPHGSEKLGRL